jgi:hypothetical protein
MKPLLNNRILDKMRRTLYGRNVEAVFYGVTPEDGEVEIGRITNGFNFVREPAKEDNNGKVKFWLVGDASITRSQLNLGGVVVITANGITQRYKITELLQQQQIGGGYVLRLSPQKGATA